MATFDIRDLDCGSENELRLCAIAYLTSPLEWDSEYNYREETLNGVIQQFTDQKSKKKLLVATCLEKVVGFHWLELSTMHEVLMGKIHSLWVHKDYRNLGIAKRLKQTGEEWAKTHGAESMYTRVSTDNSKMLSINEKYGFKAKSINMFKDF